MGYRKIPKITPSKYKPPKTRNAKNPLLNRPSEYKPPQGGLVLGSCLKCKAKQSKNGKAIRLAQSVLKRKFPSIDKPLRI